MRCDQEAKLIITQGVSDGFGGTINTPIEVGTIRCIITPIIDVERLQYYGRDNKAKWTVVTLDKITASNFLIKSGDKVFRVIEDKSYPRNRRVMVCEEDI